MTTVARHRRMAVALGLLICLPLVGGDVLVASHATSSLGQLVTLLRWRGL